MSTDSEKALPAPLETVSKAVGMHPDTEMNAVGLAMGAIIVVLLVPLLPFIAAAYLIMRVRDYLNRATTGEEPDRIPGPHR